MEELIEFQKTQIEALQRERETLKQMLKECLEAMEEFKLIIKQL